MPRMTLAEYRAYEARQHARAVVDHHEEPPKRLQIIITGQIRGGKNNICITRSGHRYPNKQWAAWRDKAVQEVLAQIPYGMLRIEQSANIRLDYVAGDKRRRDMPAIIDSIFHVLEKAGVVKDDTLLWVSESSRTYSKDFPKAVIAFDLPTK
jgi:Holliday junction resolvase RusA-like endonuclease